MRSVILFGGYGTFGSIVARELVQQGLSVTIAGRDGERAEAFAHLLGSTHRGVAADLTDHISLAKVLHHHAVAVNCAGPFSTLGPKLLEGCLVAGCHYVDIADDRRYTAMVRNYGERFRERGLTAAFGCSSLPGISGALGLLASADVSSIPDRARVTLFVGNKNPKGTAAIQSVIELLGKPIQVPQGIVRGFQDREAVPLPEPFSRRAVFNFESPEYDLFPGLLGVKSVSVKIGLQSRSATYALAVLAKLSANYGKRTARLFERVGEWTRGLGSSGGAVMTELFYADGTVRSACLLARENGQRMAALLCVLVAEGLVNGKISVRGAVTAFEVIGGATLIERLIALGYELHEASP